MKKNRKTTNLKQLKSGFAELMKTETSITVKEKSYSLRLVRLGLVLVSLLLVLVILVNLFSLPSRRLNTIDMELGAGGEYSMLPLSRDLLVYNNQGLKAVDKKGNVRWSADRAVSQPFTETKGDYVFSGDLAGNNTAFLYKSGKLLHEFNLGSDLISAEVNTGGDVVIATATVGYKGKVTVFDKKGRERFSWNSGEGYIMDVAINDSGRYVAVAQLTSNDKQSGSRIQFIDLGRKKVVNTADRPNTIISEVKFAGNRLLSVSDTELCGFSKSGKLKFEVSFAGKKPGKYDISNDELLAFVTTDNRGGEVLELYSKNGRLKGSYNADSSITSLVVCSDGAMLCTRRDILYISKRGNLKKQVTSDHDIRSLGLFGDGKTVMAIGSDSADVVRMR